MQISYHKRHYEGFNNGFFSRLKEPFKKDSLERTFMGIFLGFTGDCKGKIQGGIINKGWALLNKKNRVSSEEIPLTKDGVQGNFCDVFYVYSSLACIVNSLIMRN